MKERQVNSQDTQRDSKVKRVRKEMDDTEDKQSNTGKLKEVFTKKYKMWASYQKK